MIELLTASTPNGWKASIALEEMGATYHTKQLTLSKMEQKKDWFLALNPNGRIPVIIDKENDDFVVFESGAILVYLAEKFGKFYGNTEKERSLVMQWLMFQMGGVGPMQGQAGVFYRYAPEKIPYAIDRYQKETSRLYSVLNTQLEKTEYLAGEYSIADMATWPWVASHEWVNVSVEEFTHLKRWLEAVGSRPAVKKGRDVPEPVDIKSKAEKIKSEGSSILV